MTFPMWYNKDILTQLRANVNQMMSQKTKKAVHHRHDLKKQPDQAGCLGCLTLALVVDLTQGLGCFA